ncbi:hypothetical protein, partial [Akkermansia sp.]|uniref:hypothetical protein n=1 Tax=Akkermansia sp. TaxID=1872421 RepID=UPI003AB40C38
HQPWQGCALPLSYIRLDGSADRNRPLGRFIRPLREKATFILAISPYAIHPFSAELHQSVAYK